MKSGWEGISDQEFADLAISGAGLGPAVIFLTLFIVSTFCVYSMQGLWWKVAMSVVAAFMLCNIWVHTSFFIELKKRSSKEKS